MSVNHDRPQVGYADAHPPREAFLMPPPEKLAGAAQTDEQAPAAAPGSQAE